MTGYGRSTKSLYDREITVEIRAVNHRYSEISIKMPRIMAALEDSLRKLILKKISRGKIDLYVSYRSNRNDDMDISVNTPLADGYVRAFNELRDRYGIKEDIPISLIAKSPDVLNVEKNAGGEEVEREIWECLSQAAYEALDNFILMRETEGKTLKENIIEKLEEIERILVYVEEKAPEAVKDYEKRLRSKISEINSIEIDESRLLAEILIFSDKVCIDEEITRLKSHTSQMYSVIEEVNPIGRKLDFLVQEMNREANTIGAKSNNIDITNSVVAMKGKIEKIREQVQNIE